MLTRNIPARQAVAFSLHTITVEVSGRTTRRSMDAIGYVLGLAATAAQLTYVYSIVEDGTAPPSAPHLAAAGLIAVVICINITVLISALYCASGNTISDQQLQGWLRPWSRKLVLALTAPWSIDAVPLAMSGHLGERAPCSERLRAAVVRGGLFVNALQHLPILYVLFVAGDAPDSAVGQACAGLTLADVAFSLPRRLSYLLVALATMLRESQAESAVVYEMLELLTSARALHAAKPPTARGSAPLYHGLADLFSREPPDLVQGPSGQIYHAQSLGCLSAANPLRRRVICAVEHCLFEPLILITIMCNCATMAWESPLGIVV